MICTESEALEKWCPFTNKHCKAGMCMLFESAGEEIRGNGETIITSNVDEKLPTIKVFKCSIANIPIISVGNVSMPIYSQEEEIK